MNLVCFCFVNVFMLLIHVFASILTQALYGITFRFETLYNSRTHVLLYCFAAFVF